MTLQEYLKTFTSCTRIKKGGQKTVYRSYRGVQSFALKIIHTANDPRIQQEIEILKSICITGIPCIIETGFIVDSISGDTILYILEEFIEGQSLRDILDKQKKVTTAEGCSILESLLIIEQELEKLKIIHRDIKPDNVMVSNGEAIYLIDFGIAKVFGKTSLTNTAQAFGPCTPAYAPKELATNLKTQQDVRTDLYQIGVTIYEALSGINPFSQGAKDRDEIFSRSMTLSPPNIFLEGDSKGMLMKYLNMLMAKNPSQRPLTASQALKYFRAILPTIQKEN